MTPEQEQKYRAAIRQAVVMASPEFSYQRLQEKLSAFDPDSEYLHTGKTCREVLAENFDAVEFHRAMLVYLDGLIGLANHANAVAVGAGAAGGRI